MKCPGKIWLVDEYTQICIFLLLLITAFDFFLKFKKYFQMEMCLDIWQKTTISQEIQRLYVIKLQVRLHLSRIFPSKFKVKTMKMSTHCYCRFKNWTGTICRSKYYVCIYQDIYGRRRRSQLSRCVISSSFLPQLT